MIDNSISSVKMDYQTVTANKTTPPSNPVKIESNIADVPIKSPKKTALGGFVNYKDLLSKTVPTMSDDVFLEKAKEQAQRDFANNIFQGSEFGALCGAYVSVVSPDRAGIIESATKDAGYSNQKRTLHLWEILLQLEKGNEAALPVSHYDVNPDGSVHSMTICDSSGNPVIRYQHDRGWMEIFTPEEETRSKAFMQVYNEAWKQSKAEVEKSSFEQVPGDLGVGSYDARA